jgi:glycosyltransferase involved in cell wall biosynthesis
VDRLFPMTQTHRAAATTTAETYAQPTFENLTQDQATHVAIDVSVVMPCLNEAETVGDCVQAALTALDRARIRGEIIVVDNGSTDGSALAAERAGARVFHERRRGYGAAYLRGFEEADGRYIVMGDSDGTYDFSEVARFVEPLFRDEADVVMGSRFKGTIQPGAMSWSHRWIGNPILSAMLRVMFRTRVSDSHTGMRAFTREAYEKMAPSSLGMEFASELVVNALREELRIHELPINYGVRAGESKLNSFRDAWRHMRFMLLYAPSWLFLFPGLVLVSLGVLITLYLGGGPKQVFGREWDFHVLLMGALAANLGYNLVLFDLFAKTFAVGARLMRAPAWLRRFLSAFSLEKGIVAGALIFLAGAAIEAKIVMDWLLAGQNELMAVRGIVIGMSAMLAGAQTTFASFLVSLMLIRR